MACQATKSALLQRCLAEIVVDKCHRFVGQLMEPERIQMDSFVQTIHLDTIVVATVAVMIAVLVVATVVVVGHQKYC